MRICYVNEAGCSGELPSVHSPVQPLLAFAGIALPAARLERLTAGFAAWKMRFFPGLCRDLAAPAEAILVEIPGSELRRLLRRSRKERRFALRALHELLALLEAEDTRLFGRVWIKGIDEPFNRRAIFASSLQTIFEGLENLCRESGESGWIVADEAHRQRGEKLSQQIFARLFADGRAADPGGSGGGIGGLAELPTFGHRDNHAGLQIAELLAAGLLFPLAAHAYCRGRLKNQTHLSPGYAALAPLFGERLETMQHRYDAGAGRWRGGIVVSDLLGGRPGGRLFREPANFD